MEEEGLGDLVMCMVCARWGILNIWSKDWRLECSKGSVNQYSLLFDRLRLISKKFMSYNNQVPPPMCLPSVYLTSSHMIKSSRSSLSIYAYQKLELGRSWELFTATFVLCSRAGSFTGYLGMRLGRNHYRCLFVCLLFKVSSGLCHQYLINLILEAFIPRKGS